MVVALAASGGRAAGPFDDLLMRVPGDANFLKLIDVEGVLNSPLGKQQNWVKKHENEFLHGASHIPPGTTRMLMAAQLNPTTLQPTWKLGLGTLKQPITIAQCAKSEGGVPEQVAGHNVALSRRDAYFVEVTPNTLGVWQPANRQALGRWLRFADRNKDVAISPYLRDAAAAAGNQAQIVLGLDLADVFDPEGVRYRLKGSSTLAGKPVNLEAFTRIVSSLKGLKFAVRIEYGINGELRIDFGEPVAPLGDYAKPLVLEALENIGAAIEELNDWDARLERNAIVMQGRFSERGLRQVLSVITLPPPNKTGMTASVETRPPQTPGTPGQFTQDPRAVASQAYFKSVNQMLFDLRNQKVKSFKALGTWYDTYALKIDQLPMLNVDEDLLKYGMSVSGKLRTISQSARGVSINNSLLEQSKGEQQITSPGSAWFGGGPGWAYGYYDPGINMIKGNYGQVRAVQDQIGAAEGQARFAIWKMIDDETVTIRKQMVEKYQVEFPAATMPALPDPGKKPK
jgi:hypothetical protein